MRDDSYTGRVTGSADRDADRASADGEADRTSADRTGADGEADRARVALRRLAGDDDATVVRRATAGVEDLEAAAAFVEEVGLDRLEVAVEAVQEPTLRAEGTRALEAFGRFRAAAAGDLEPGDATDHPTDHFRRGRGTDLRGDGQSSAR